MAWILTPVPWTFEEIFRAFSPRLDTMFWLDSTEGEDRRQQSMLTLDLQRVASVSADGQLDIPGESVGVGASDAPWMALDGLVQAYRRREKSNPGGLVAWLSYTSGFLGKPEAMTPPHPEEIPMLEVYETRAALIRKQGKNMLLVCGDTPADANLGTIEWVKTIKKALRDAVKPSPATETDAWDAKPLVCTDPGDEATYRHTVQRIQEAIAQGTLQQVCPTYPIRFARPESMAAWYLRLREISPSAYGAFVRTPALECASTSPECFFEIRQRHVWTRPMKGTRKRGTMPDDALAEELRNNPKDRAENGMIAEMALREMEAICEPGTARISKKFTVETYATVLQLTSTVLGDIRGDVGPFQAYGALSPPASMTGDPKPVACEMLRALEPSPRGLYSGCVAWIDGNLRAQFSVVIRALQAFGDEASWHVGGGIVAASEPGNEWAESRAKALAVIPDEP